MLMMKWPMEKRLSLWSDHKNIKSLFTIMIEHRLVLLVHECWFVSIFTNTSSTVESHVIPAFINVSVFIISSSYCVRESARNRTHCPCEPVSSQSVLGHKASHLSRWRSVPNKPPYRADKHAGIWSPLANVYLVKRVKTWLDPYIRSYWIFLF